MTAIHIVGDVESIRRIKDSQLAHEWEGWCCVVRADAAEKLIGADLYLHEGQTKPSRFGGKITGFRIQEGGEFDGRIAFRFQATNDHRDIKTTRAGWGSDVKIIW